MWTIYSYLYVVSIWVKLPIYLFKYSDIDSQIHKTGLKEMGQEFFNFTLNQKKYHFGL